MPLNILRPAELITLSDYPSSWAPEQHDVELALPHGLLIDVTVDQHGQMVAYHDWYSPQVRVLDLETRQSRVVLSPKGGASFEDRAKQYSKDTTSAKVGGKLCVAHGGSSGACQQTVPPFDKASFSLKTNEISQPVKSVYGYHIIQALSPIKPAHTQTFSQVASQIQLNLAQQKKQTAWADWLAKVKKDYAKKVSYQSGYTPATTTTPTVSTPATTTG